LESTWRGLEYLVNQTQTGPNLKVKVLDVDERALARDCARAAEFDQTALFKLVYTTEYHTPGGEPFGLLVGDFEFDGRAVEDVALLRAVAGVAAAAHAPFVAAAGPGMFGVQDFAELLRARQVAGRFEGPEYGGWQSFRDSEDSRYVALTVPRVLAR